MTYLFVNPLLVHIQTIRKLTFGPDRIVEGGPKASFGTVYQSRDHEFFENPFWSNSFEGEPTAGFDHVITNFEEEFGCTKTELACIWVT